MSLASSQLAPQIATQHPISKTDNTTTAPQSKLNSDLNVHRPGVANNKPAAGAAHAGSKILENKHLKKPAVDKSHRESFSDSVLAEIKKIEDERTFYMEMLARIEKQTTAHSKSVDASQALSQWIRDHGSRSVVAHEDPVYAKCILQSAEVLRFAEVLRSQVTLMWTHTVMARANEFVTNNIDETLAIKNRVETLKNALDSTNNKLKNMTTKGKVNLVKLSELRRERDMLIVKYKEAKAKTLPNLLDTNHKHKAMFMGTMCDVLAEYSQFFQHGMSILANIESEVGEYRTHITKENEKYAKAQAEAAAEKDEDEDLLEPKDEATFSDVLSKMLMESEKTYLSQLDSVVKVYQQTFLSDGSLFSEMTKDDVTAMFGNAEVLAEVQRKLLDSLHQHSSNLTTEAIARSFVNFTDALSEVYTQYIKNHNRAQETLEACKKKSKALCNTLKVCEAKDPSLEKLELSNLLALPLERVKQYEAYFREIHKKETSEPVKAVITQVLDCYSRLSTAAYESANQAKIKSILEVVNVNPEPPTIENTLTSSVKGVIGAAQATLSPEESEKWYARKFIREGPLNVVEPTTTEKKAVKEYYFFLFNDVFMGVKRNGLPKAMGGSSLAFLKGKVHAKYLWPINHTVVSDIPDEDGIKYCISLTINGAKHVLSAESEDAKQFWIFEITKALDQLEKRKIFGVPLEELMTQTNEVGRDIPSFFENCMEFILANAIDEEGIFRLSGSTNDIEKMRAKVDKGLELNFYGNPYHNVSGLLKLFIRSLPDPFVTYDLYGPMLGAVKQEPRSEKVRYTKLVLEKMPPYNKYLLQYLMRSLSQITKHAATNKMTPYNLSIVFGPHCLKKRQADPVSELADSKVIYDSVQLMIEEHDAIFSDIAAEREGVRQRRAQQQLELAQKNKAVNTKQYKLEPTVAAPPSSHPNTSQQDDEDDNDEESDARLQGITISLKDIVKQGFLQKKGGNRRNWTSRWFVLKNKFLFYFKSQKDQTPKGMISLVGVKMSYSNHKAFCFAITSANREYLICGKSQAEVDEWMAAIKTCTSDN